MKKRRVLIIAANDMGNSGVPNVYMQIVRNLSDEFIFDILITREDYYYKDEFLSFGGQIFLLKERDYKNKIKRLWWRQFGLPKATKKFLKTILRNNKYDIIHSFKESESWMYLKEAKKFGIEKRIIHNNRQKELGNSVFVSRYTKRSIRKSLRYSTSNISVSKATGLTFFGSKEFDVIYNSVDFNKYYFKEQEIGQNLNLIQIGTFLPLKNQLFTLDVISKLIAKYPKLKTVFVGKIFDTTYYDLFKQKISELKIENNVQIADKNGNIADFIDHANYSLIPSYNEGLSLVAIESQACGIHVFASKGVPIETDLGNIEYLELNSELWANMIEKEFDKNHGRRKKVDVAKFSPTVFKDKIKSVYNSSK